MEHPDPTIRFLQTKSRRAADTFCDMALLFTVGGVVMTAFFMFHGVLEPVVAGSVYALCSTALIGLGLLRSQSRNLPALLGTTIAILAAAYTLSQVLSAYPNQQVPLILAFASLAIGAWTTLMSFGQDFWHFTMFNSSWRWHVAAAAYTFVVFSIPFVPVLVWAWVSRG